jgi:hypothetical protein
MVFILPDDARTSGTLYRIGAVFTIILETLVFGIRILFIQDINK